MYNFSGIFYRLWAECGIIALIGLLCLLIAKRDKEHKDNRSTVLAGWLCILWAVGLTAYYSYCLARPDIQIYEGAFDSEVRNSRVAPPLPFTMEYGFYDDNGESSCFYLDVLSEKEIFQADLEKGRCYTVVYERRTNIILEIE